MKKILAVDLDEVLSETLDELLKFHNYQVRGIPFVRSDVTDYHLHKIKHKSFTIDDDYFVFNTFFDSGKSCDLPVVIGAREQLQNIKASGRNISIITARKTIFEEATRKRVDIHYPGIFSNIIFANHYTEHAKPKSELCKELGAEIMIEDNLDYAIDCAAHGIKVYLLDKPRNQSYDPNIHHNIIKVSSWEKIVL